MGEISGGEALEKHLADLGKRVSHAVSLRVGFLEDATYPDGTSVAQVAAIQNFGAPAAGIPPRPFFTNAVRKGRGSWGPKLGYLLKQNGYDGAAALDVMGQVIQAEIQEEIVLTMAPKLSEVTLWMRRLVGEGMERNFATLSLARAHVAAGDPSGVSGTGAKPLVDTGNLLNSVSYEVAGGTGGA